MMKRTDLVIVILLILSPLIINNVLLIPSLLGYSVNGSYDGWLSFFGALVGSLVTMCVLYRTRRWNKEDNDETRRIQSSILKYQAKSVWFENLRKQLDSNFRILNFQDTSFAINDIVAGNYNKACAILIELSKNVEMQTYTSDLYFQCEKLCVEEIDYMDCYCDVLKQYGTFINDMILICGILQRVQNGLSVKEYLEESVSCLMSINHNNKEVRPSPFLLLLTEVIKEDCCVEDIQIKCKQRIREFSTIHSLKTKLIHVTKILLQYEENQIGQILVNKQ